ncbi:glycosyltransferase family 2 protein [Arthrobacter crystallopoietes]|uniref:glycosyltransferase family 2 protein n=1 Tax=Crystallibacter crystallopoietes TaxID=37928 RepID=UPI0011111360|nr:glycosyltransferase family 2 protein [Arthrobacter crystallopoietes]
MNAGEISVSIIMATFNRRHVTERCLSALKRCDLPENMKIQITVVDASSSDGTAEMLRQEHGNVDLISVPTNQYWAQCMRRAWEQAQRYNPEFILWLNDDVILDSNALVDLFRTSARYGHRAIVSGATRNTEGQVSYTGYIRGPGSRKLSFSKLDVAGRDQSCDAINGNIVLVPRQIDQLLGGFPRHYIHGMADFAYSLRARKKGIRVIVASGTAGLCDNNAVKGSWRDVSLGRRERLRLLNSPKGLPFNAWLRYCMSFGGPLSLAYFVKPYLDVLFRAGQQFEFSK